MTNTRRILAFMLAIFLVASVISPAVFAAGGPVRFVASDANGKPGETVTVTVSLENNPGIIAAALEIGYDADKLKLTAVTDSKLLKEPTFSETLNQNPYYVSWNDALASGNHTANGVLVTLKFEILAGCTPGTTEIRLAFRANDVFNWELNNVAAATKNGVVTVLGSAGTGGMPPAADPVPPAEEEQPLPQPEEPKAGSAYDSYTDLAARSWYREDVEFILEMGLMNGVGEASFAPDGAMTRGQLVTILYRAAGSPDVSGLTNPFVDVKASAWYGKAVLWGAANGIVRGVSADRFAPNDNITREQIATLLYRYDRAAPLNRDCLKGYQDVSAIGSYAMDAMNWAVGNGIMNGTSDVTLSPGATATRVQTAVLLSRYLKMTEAVPVPTTPVVTQ